MGSLALAKRSDIGASTLERSSMISRKRANGKANIRTAGSKLGAVRLSSVSSEAGEPTGPPSSTSGRGTGETRLTTVRSVAIVRREKHEGNKQKEPALQVRGAHGAHG